MSEQTCIGETRDMLTPAAPRGTQNHTIHAERKLLAMLTLQASFAFRKKSMPSLLSSHARKSIQELTYTRLQTQDAPELTTLAHTSSGQELRRVQGEHICKGYGNFGTH